jgi:DNA/RNA-binding domain of Phe-tRNA-synthetase-like protein
MMKFKIDTKIFEKFPELKIGVVTARNIDNHDFSAEIMHLIREKEREIRENYDAETLSQHPKIRSWRVAYSSFGAKPKKYKSSIESLYRMILKGLDLRHINKIVDLYNYISLKRMIPAGGDDMAKVDGDIILKFAAGNEPFTSLNSTERETAKEGEVVYADNKEVLCRRWNWRECDKTKMTEETKDVILVIEALPPVTREELEEVEEDLSRLITEYCGGEIRSAVLDEGKSEIEI